jgi:hypothetical protein
MKYFLQTFSRLINRGNILSVVNEYFFIIYGYKNNNRTAVDWKQRLWWAKGGGDGVFDLLSFSNCIQLFVFLNVFCYSKGIT